MDALEREKMLRRLAKLEEELIAHAKERNSLKWFLIFSLVAFPAAFFVGLGWATFILISFLVFYFVGHYIAIGHTRETERKIADIKVQIKKPLN